MENALWNEKLITAAKISSDYYLEKQIRMASGRKELFCPDPDCENSVLRYCHGEKKEAYFAHLNNVDCDYAKFDKENSSVLRKIKKLLYEHFTGLGYDVKIEVKLLKHYYTHLLITKTDGKQIAIELGTQRLSANKVENLTRKYNEAGVSVCWIVVSELNFALKENQTYFIKRYSLNESRSKTLITISFDGQTVAQYKLDQNQYVLNGRVVVSENYPDVFMKTSSINNLVFIEDELTLCDFDKEFDEFIDLPNSITTIGEQAFRFDTALESITISSSLNHLPDDVFQGCENIKSVTFKDNCVMTEIEEAFRLCANLTSVDFGENSRLTTIGEYAFQSCPIESVVIPSSVTEIEQGAFSGGVKSITFEENSQLTTIGQNAFANGLYTNIDLPETVTSIEKYAFRASALESITIPGSIKNIPSSCFRNCEALTNVILDVGVENIESLAFYNCSALKNIVIPNTVTSIGNQVFNGCNSLGTIIIPVSVTKIDNAFLGRLSGAIIINYEGTEEQWVEATGGKTLSGVSSPTINYQS